jgi:hypothetical protein
MLAISKPLAQKLELATDLNETPRYQPSQA